MVTPSIQNQLQYLLLQPSSCTLLSQEQEEVGVPAPLLSLLSPLLACLLAQTQDPTPCLFLPSSATTIRSLLESLVWGKEVEKKKQQEMKDLAAILGINQVAALQKTEGMKEKEKNSYNTPKS